MPAFDLVVRMESFAGLLAQPNEARDGSAFTFKDLADGVHIIQHDSDKVGPRATGLSRTNSAFH